MSVTVVTRVRPLFDVPNDLFRDVSPSASRRSMSARGRSPESYDLTRRHLLALETGASCMSVEPKGVTVLPIKTNPESKDSARGRQGAARTRAVTPRGTKSQSASVGAPFSRMVSGQSQATSGGRSSFHDEDGAPRGRLAEPIKFGFDRCFSSDKGHPQFASQRDIYDNLGKPALTEFMHGYNCCIMAYGQTGSGKTYTMLGPHWDEIRQNWSPERERQRQRKHNLMQALANSTQRGLMMRMCSDLFKRLQEAKLDTAAYQRVEFKVHVSFYQIYQEKVTCLLEPEQGALRVRLDHKHSSLPDLPRREVRSFSEMMDVLEEGTKNRKSDPTMHNEHSSRSHAIFSIYLESNLKRHGSRAECLTRVMNLVDLAGSEQLGGTMNISKTRQHETAKINSSLSALSRVMNALASKNPNTHIPYRESTLTWLLKDSLGGNSKTFLLATISPEPRYQSESLSTLRYACKARRIVNKPMKNTNVERSLKELTREADDLRKQLHSAQGGDQKDKIQAELDECRREMSRLEEVKAEQQRRLDELAQALAVKDEMLAEKEVEIHHLKAQILESHSNRTSRRNESPSMPGGLDFEIELHRGKFDTPFVKTSHHSKPNPKGLSESPFRIETTRPLSTTASVRGSTTDDAIPVYNLAVDSVASDLSQGESSQEEEQPLVQATTKVYTNKTVTFSDKMGQNTLGRPAQKTSEHQKDRPSSASSVGFPASKEEGQNWLQIFFDKNPKARMTEHLRLRCQQFDFTPPSTVVWPEGSVSRSQQEQGAPPHSTPIPTATKSSPLMTRYQQIAPPAATPQPMGLHESRKVPQTAYTASKATTTKRASSSSLSLEERRNRIEQWKNQLATEKQQLKEVDSQRRAVTKFRREVSAQPFQRLTTTESPTGTTTSSEGRSEDTKETRPAVVPRIPLENISKPKIFSVNKASGGVNDQQQHSSFAQASRGPSAGSSSRTSTCSSVLPRQTQLSYVRDETITVPRYRDPKSPHAVPPRNTTQRW